MIATSNSLARLLQLSIAASDEQFKALMVERQHSPAVVAPAAFRAMLLKISPFRFGLSWGYNRRDGKTGAFWFLSEFGALGTPDAVTRRITGALAAEAFSTVKSTGSGEYLVDMTRHEGALRQSCKIERIDKFTGTRDARSGGHVIYEAELQETSQLLTVQQVIDAWPALACDDLPEPFKAFLYPLVASEVSQGGTWTRYYDWTATIEATQKRSTEIFDDMKQLVQRHGWVLDRDDRGTFTYFLEKTKAPVIFLSTEQGDGVQFRIQPRM